MATATSITLTEQDGKLIVQAPYAHEFPPAAKRLSGHWSAADKTWRFDPRDRDRVEELLRNIYGWSGSEGDSPEVTIRVKVTPRTAPYREVRFGGRLIAWRPGRDADIVLGEGVIIVDGKFSARGGSMKHPRIFDGPEGDVTLEVRDYPVSALQLVDLPYEVVDGDPMTELREERDRLIARIAEIDALLCQSNS